MGRVELSPHDGRVSLGLVVADHEALDQRTVLGEARCQLRDLGPVRVRVGRCTRRTKHDRCAQSHDADADESDGNSRAPAGPAAKLQLPPQAGLRPTSPATSGHNGVQCYAFGGQHPRFGRESV